MDCSFRRVRLLNRLSFLLDGLSIRDVSNESKPFRSDSSLARNLDDRTREAALLACAVYVDLNPIRAALAETLATSDFTSVQRRIESRQRKSTTHPRPDRWLAPLPLDEATTAPGPQVCTAGHRASDKGFLPIELDEYLRLAEWTARQTRRGCEGPIPAAIDRLLVDVGISARDWLPLVARFGRLFRRVAGGTRSPIRSRTSWHFRRGRAELLGRG
jgi:hypothetical protein